ncbi:MAG: putative membrane protein [Polaribacter sp.]|jgi:uncharacterized membrane protein
MPKENQFLTKDEEQEIVSAIKTAETKTSGEIRIHIEATSETGPFERALVVFEELEMQNTEQRNGVLLYIAVNDHQFAICGDEGIDKVVADDFWDCTRDIMASHFKKGHFKEGIVAGVLNAGEQLKRFFPWQTDDTNELSNEISKG